MSTLDCLVTGRGVDEAERTANTDYINAALAAGGEVHFPVDALVEVNSKLEISADVRVYLHGARLIARGDIATQRLFNVANTGLAVGIQDGVLEGFTEAEVVAVGNTGSYGIFGRADMSLALENVSFDEWFGNALQGSSGVSVHIDGGYWQAWGQIIAGGDGAKEYIVHDVTFGRVGSGGGNAHQMYINPDVYLYLDRCTFLNDENGQGWSVHYYGSDPVGPERTPTFTGCNFYRKVFTNPKKETIVRGCNILDTLLLVRADTVIDTCAFIGSDYKWSRSYLRQFDPGPIVVRVTNPITINASFDLTAPVNSVAGFYWIRDVNLKGSVIHAGRNHVEVHSGRWESGIARTSAGGTLHLDGRLHLSSDVVEDLQGGVITKGEIVPF